MWVLEGHDRTLRNALKMHGNHRLCLINAQHRAYTNTSRTGISINGSSKPTLSMWILHYRLMVGRLRGQLCDKMQTQFHISCNSLRNFPAKSIAVISKMYDRKLQA